mgnify:CR=1 FL=1
MGFLSELTLVQRAAGAAVLVLILVMLLVKQRQAKAGPAVKAADATTEPSKLRKSAPNDKKGRSIGAKRKRKGKSDDDLDLPIAEPKAGQGRMVPRLPAASEAAVEGIAADPVDFPEATDAVPAAAVAGANGMISEPGWPTPGEVWAADAGAPAPVEAWEATAQDHALEALTEIPEADTAEWASDENGNFDAADGWDASSDETPVPVDDSDATWQAEEETFDWTANDAIDGWATSAPDEATDEVSSGEAAWEAPDDETPSWNPTETSEWNAMEQEEHEEDAPAIATAVAEEFSINDWAPPVDTLEVEAAAEVGTEASEAVEIETPEIVWDPVDEVEDLVDAIAIVPEATVSEPELEVEPEVEIVLPTEQAELTMILEAPAVAEAIPAAESPVTAVDDEPAVASALEETAVAAFEAPIVESEPVADLTEEPLYDHSPFETIEAGEFEMMAVPVAVAPVTALAGGRIADPAARWASMTPGGIAEVSSPAESWARLRPGHTAAVARNGATATAVAPMPAPAEATAPSLAWWDVPSGMESDPRRGRFALGGYALQPGHQVVSGVTFRDGVVPPPSHWVIGPVVGEVAPGTLVLHVDGCLNCRPEDLAVLTDPGFAPTTDGFSLRLAAAAIGPFAASGTYIIS